MVYHLVLRVAYRGHDYAFVDAAGLYLTKNPPRQHGKDRMNELLKAMEAAVERMEAVAEGILIEKRHKGVSPETHVSHMASHLAQHAKIARAALEKANSKITEDK